MGSAGTAYIWTMRAIFVGLTVIVLLAHLLPLETQPRRWVGPDILFALALAWTIRRPDLVPVLLVAAVFVLADFLLQRPPGLFAALVVVATELARLRHADLRDAIFVAEWLNAVILILATYLVYMAIWAIAAPTPLSATLTAMQAMLTVAIYPVVVGLSQVLCGIRMAAPGEVDEHGRPL